MYKRRSLNMNDNEMHEVQGLHNVMEDENNGVGRTDFSGRLETRGNGFSEKRVYSQTYILNLLRGLRIQV
jgi:hypothetical protein